MRTNQLKARETHGDRYTKLYSKWTDMKQRCNNPNNSRYESYGGRNISVCNKWNNSYIAFKKWALSSGYKEGLSLDRRDNDLNYNSSNCRWTTLLVQNRNTKILKVNNTSGFRGVCLNPNKKRWKAQINVNGKKIAIGTFDYPWTAALAYDSYIINNNLEHTTNTKRNIS